MTAPHIDVMIHNFNLETSDFIARMNTVTQTVTGGQSFLHELAREGDTLTAEVLLTAGADADAPDEEGRRPLHDAAFFGHLQMVLLLLSQGALIDAPIHPFGHTALYLAVQQGRHAVAAHLVESGARLSVCDALSGRGLLHAAVESGDMRMTGMLVAAGINVFHEDRNGLTARDVAAKRGFTDLAAVLAKVMMHHARYGA